MLFACACGIAIVWLSAGGWNELYLRAGKMRLSFQRGGVAVWWDVQSLTTSAYNVAPVGPYLQAPLWVEHTRGGVRGLLIPYWAMLVPILGVCGWLMRTQPNVSDNACAACGYSLRGNESGTCPECGAVVPIEDRVNVAAE